MCFLGWTLELDLETAVLHLRVVTTHPKDQENEWHCNVGSKLNFGASHISTLNSPSISRSAIRFRFLNPGTSFHCNVGSKFWSKSYFNMNSPSISRSAIRFRFLNPGTSFHKWHCNVGSKFRSKSYFDMNSPHFQSFFLVGLFWEICIAFVQKIC